MSDESSGRGLGWVMLALMTWPLVLALVYWLICR